MSGIIGGIFGRGQNKSGSGIVDEESLIPTGGIITEYVDTNRYRSHTFLASGTFWTPIAITTDFLIVGGGGGGGALGGGGGAGEFLTFTNISVVAGAHSVECGFGGMASTSYGTNAQRGGLTQFLDYSAYPGGGGGSYNNVAGSPAGFSENTSDWNRRGSGGGGGCSANDTENAGGAGGGGGNAGGTGTGNGTAPNRPYDGGGGGGAGAVGGSIPNGVGGVGLANTYRDGTSIFYAGGGRGYVGSAKGTGHTYGGGGNGHAGGEATVGTGRTGCVIIRYQIG